MHSDHVGPNRSFASFCAGMSRFLSSHGLVGLVAIAAFGASPRALFAQTRSLSLGSASNFGVLEMSNGYSPYGLLTVSNSTIYENVGLGSNTQFSATSSFIGGAVYEGTNVTGTSSGITVAGGVSQNTALVTAATTSALAAYTQAATYTTNTASLQSNSGGYTITSTGSENVYNFATNPNLNGSTITISGTGQFVFNFSNGLTLMNTNFVFKNGATASNVIFNITGGSVSITGSNFGGTILDGSKGSIALTNDVIHGNIISDGSITIMNSVIAPELPTFMMAGLACFAVIAGNAGFRWLPRRTAPVGPTVSPQT